MAFVITFRFSIINYYKCSYQDPNDNSMHCKDWFYPGKTFVSYYCNYY